MWLPGALNYVTIAVKKFKTIAQACVYSAGAGERKSARQMDTIRGESKQFFNFQAQILKRIEMHDFSWDPPIIHQRTANTQFGKLEETAIRAPEIMPNEKWYGIKMRWRREFWMKNRWNVCAAYFALMSWRIENRRLRGFCTVPRDTEGEKLPAESYFGRSSGTVQSVARSIHRVPRWLPFARHTCAAIILVADDIRLARPFGEIACKL